MAKAPAFQLYANDFMDATSTWEANAVGLYIRCLCKQWTHGSIPSDLKILARAIHTEREELQACWDVIQTKFVQQPDGTLKNSKLEEVRGRQEEISKKRSEAGKLGANAKANASVLPLAKNKQRKVKEKEKENIEVEVEVEEERVPEFSEWWADYAKGSRKLSEEAWDKLSNDDRRSVVAKTPAYIKSKPDKLFRKDGERFLKHRTWEDPIVEPTTKAIDLGSDAATLKSADPTRRLTGEWA